MKRETKSKPGKSADVPERTGRDAEEGLPDLEHATPEELRELIRRSHTRCMELGNDITGLRNCCDDLEEGFWRRTVELERTIASLRGELARREQMEKELQGYRGSLEEQVAERTAELAETNRILRKEIEERKVVEDSLRESEQRFRLLAENSTDMISRLTPKGIYIYVSPASRALLGYDSEELVGCSVYDFFHPDDRDKVGAFHTRILQEGVPGATSYRIRRKDGEYVWFETTCRAVRDPRTGAVAEVQASSRDITGWVRAEQALRESEERERARSAEMETVLDAVPAAVWIAHDPFGIHITGNRFSYEWLGLPVGANPSKSAPEGERPETFRIFKDGVELQAGEMPVQVSAAGREIRNYEFDLVYPDGSVRHMLGNATPLWDEHGNPRGSVSAFIDITERKQADEALRESEEIMRYIVRHDPNAIAVYDNDLRYIAVSDRFLHDYGVKEEDVIGRYHYDIFPEMPERWKDVHQRCLAGVIERNEDDRFERPDGSITYNRWECRPWYRSDGRIAGMIIYSEVTTERKKAEMALRKSEERFRAAVDNFPGIFVVYDPERRIQFLNRQGIENSGHTLEEIIGRRDEEVFPVTITDQYLPALLRAIETRAPQTLEVKLASPEREYWMLMSFVPLLSERGEIWQILSISLDITIRKQAEERIHNLNERLRRQTEQLTAANREMEAFSYSVSHDLRAPLRSIDGFSATLLEDFSDILGEEGRDSLQRIRAAAQRMGHLIDDLLNLSRTSRAEMRQRRVDLSALAKEILEDLRKANPDREAETVVREGIIVEGDTDLLRQVMDNLLRNAWKFTSRTPHARIEFGTAREQDQTVYFVRDNGAGFDMRYANRLFIPFRRLHSEEEFPGTGIGLSIVSRIIHRHDGEIWAEGEVGKGAVFSFTLHAPRPGARTEAERESGSTPEYKMAELPK